MLATAEPLDPAALTVEGVDEGAGAPCSQSDPSAREAVAAPREVVTIEVKIDDVSLFNALTLQSAKTPASACVFALVKLTRWPEADGHVRLEYRFG